MTKGLSLEQIFYYFINKVIKIRNSIVFKLCQIPPSNNNNNNIDKRSIQNIEKVYKEIEKALEKIGFILDKLHTLKTSLHLHAHDFHFSRSSSISHEVYCELIPELLKVHNDMKAIFSNIPIYSHSNFFRNAQQFREEMKKKLQKFDDILIKFNNRKILSLEILDNNKNYRSWKYKIPYFLSTYGGVMIGSLVLCFILGIFVFHNKKNIKQKIESSISLFF